MDRFLEFAGNHTLLVFALLTSFFLVVFTELRRKAAGVLSVPPADAVRLINNDAIVIDEIDGHMDKLARLKSRPVIAVCDSGVTSTKAINALRNAGFESVYGLKGGMTAWNQAGLPVVTGKKTRSKK